jgi:hypothetical protein
MSKILSTFNGKIRIPQMGGIKILGDKSINKWENTH